MTPFATVCRLFCITLAACLCLCQAPAHAQSQARAVASREARLNPSPQLRYSVSAVVHAAPGPFERVEGHVNYRVDTPACVPLTPVSGATVVPEKRVPVAFVAVGDNTYKADVVLDRFLDEDYFGQGVCHWSIVGITVELHHSKVMFSPALYNDDLLAGKKVTRFFSLRSYGHAESARIDIGAMNANAFDNPYATFSISMQAERAASNASPSMGAAGFQGDWVYQQTCGWRHAAGVSLKVRDGKATGNWSDGSGRGIGEQGSLQGDIRDGKLYAHFCTDSTEDMASDARCANFDTTQADYFVLRGDQLDWYRQSGKENVKYLTLHRRIAGKRTPTDNRCEGEQ